jgi:hypothetical protein
VQGSSSSVQDLGLLGRELLVGQHTLVAELPELLQLRDGVVLLGSRGSRRWRGVLGGHVLLVRLIALGVDVGVSLGEVLGLASLHTSGDRGCRSGDDRGAGDATK